MYQSLTIFWSYLKANVHYVPFLLFQDNVSLLFQYVLQNIKLQTLCFCTMCQPIKSKKCCELTKVENKSGVEDSWCVTRIVDVVEKTTYIN